MDRSVSNLNKAHDWLFLLPVYCLVCVVLKLGSSRSFMKQVLRIFNDYND